MLPPTKIVINIIINTLLIVMKISKKEILDMCLLRLTLPQSHQVSSTQVAQFVRQCGFCHLYNALCEVQSDVFKCNPPPSVSLLSLHSSRPICAPVWFLFCHLYNALQLHFIQCPFPNQIQFGLENLPPKIAYHFPNQFQFGLELKKMILQDADSKPNSDWFGKF